MPYSGGRHRPFNAFYPKFLVLVSLPCAHGAPAAFRSGGWVFAARSRWLSPSCLGVWGRRVLPARSGVSRPLDPAGCHRNGCSILCLPVHVL